MQQLHLLMTSDQKKTFLLLKAIVFHHHGLNEEEGRLLDETAKELDAYIELKWVSNLVATDVYTAFDRIRTHLHQLTGDWENESKLHYLGMIWEATNKKGYITEMEATTILKVAKDWKMQRELMVMVRKK
jgi:uncharacterized tellurite resistance protein B-like protein